MLILSYKLPLRHWPSLKAFSRQTGTKTHHGWNSHVCQVNVTKQVKISTTNFKASKRDICTLLCYSKGRETERRTGLPKATCQVKTVPDIEQSSSFSSEPLWFTIKENK